MSANRYFSCFVIAVRVPLKQDFTTFTDYQGFSHQLMHNWIVLKNNFKFALKFTLKSFYMFRCKKHHPQRAHYLSLAKVTDVKMS